MSKLYCIIRNKDDNPTTVGLFMAACDKRGVDLQIIQSENYDFAKPTVLEKQSMLYKISTDSRSKTVFRTLLNGDIASIYRNQDAAIAYTDNSALLHQKHGLQVIKTIFDITNDKSLLKDYAQHLGGFPLIIKVVGGSHGVGVIKVDSFESLASIADYLAAQNKDSQYMMRQFIDHDYSARLTVLDGRVIDSIRYHRVPGDFRSNAGTDLHVEPQKFGTDIERMAVDAVEVMGADFGGVDMLIDKTDTGYIAEVNIPCFFPRSQKVTGTDIAGQIIDSLLKKSSAITVSAG